MKKTGIMTDSHSGILNEEAERLGIKVLPMPFYIEEKVYREGVDLSREEFYDMLRKGTDVSTSQPSLVDVAEMWKEMLSRTAAVTSGAPNRSASRIPATAS